MSTPEDRIRLLQDLVRCSSPATVTAEALSRFPWDVEGPLVVLTRRHCVSVLDRLLRGELSAGEVEAWADALEVREDVEFEAGLVGEIVYRLANPALEGPLTAAVAEQLRGRLAEPA